MRAANAYGPCAAQIAEDKAVNIQTELDKTFIPAYVVSVSVQQAARDYYPSPQPPDLANYSNPWFLIHRPFDKLAEELIGLSKVGA